MSEEGDWDEQEGEPEEQEEWPEEEEAPRKEEEAPRKKEEAPRKEEAPPPPPPAAAEVVEEVVQEEVIEEVVVEDRFVVEFTEASTEEERKVEYQAALTTILLVELQSADTGVVALAARKLDHFFQSEEHSLHTDCFCALGGHGLLLMLLQKWQDDQAIQETLFSCLAHLSTWARSHDANVLSTILIMRGMDLIANSMNRFPDSSKLYVDCLQTITCLCRKEELDRHATTRNSITGAVPVVCKAIKAFPENRDVLHSGCRALKAFCQMNLDQIKTLKGEAISVVGASLQNFPDDTEINKIAFSFLRNLGTMCGYDTEDDDEEAAKDKGKKESKSTSAPPVTPSSQLDPPKKRWGS